MHTIADFDTSVKHEQRPHAPSTEKYGALLCEDGFTQWPRAVEEYLHSLGLCSTAILLVLHLSSYRWQPEQEVYPSVRTLAARLKVSPRRVNQLTAQLVELGLLIKTERFSERSQVANSYDLEPLYNRAAAFKNAEIATALAEQEAAAGAPFEPKSEVEQAAQIISEEFGEQQPRQQRYNAERLARRYERAGIGWEDFSDILQKAATQTEARRDEPTRTGQTFTRLVAYFFSALDWRLSKIQPAPQKQQTTQPRDAQNNKADRPAKARVPAALKCRIEAAALTFRDKAVKSSIQRAANLMAKAHLDEAQMCALVDQARAATSKAVNVRNRMAYFFKLLESKICKMMESNVNYRMV